MNRPQEAIWMIREALKHNVNERLSLKSNWTPDLVYVHVTRLVIGFVLGSAFGFFACMTLIKISEIIK